MAENYKRIILIGNSGAGKSTLAKKVGEKLDLPVHHLDIHFWGPNWEHPDDEEWRNRLIGFLSQEKWVIEGGVNNLDTRVEAADLIVYFKFPVWFCLWRVVRRYVRFMLKKEKAFLPSGCKNRLNWEFIKYVAMFPFTREKRIEAVLKEYEDKRKIVTLKSPNDVEDFEVSFLNYLNREKETSPQFAR